jgi:biopolymer transport protein ExbB/TolQ
MTESFHLHAVDCAGRAADRVSAVLRRELSHGATGLKAVTGIAPMLGIFGTALLLMDALHIDYRTGCNYGDCAGDSVAALIPILLSLPVAMLARGGFYWLTNQVEIFDLEMRVATLDIRNELAR